MKTKLKNWLGHDEQQIFLRLTSQTFVLRILGLGLLYFNQVLLARLMGVQGYGDYVVILTWVSFFVAFSIFGFDFGALRFFSSSYINKDWRKVRGYLRFSFRTILLVSLMGMVVLFFVLLSKSKRFPLSYSEALFWAIFIIPLLAVTYMSSSIFRALHRVRLALASVYVFIPVSISIVCFLYYYLHNKELKVDAAVMLNMLCTFFIAWFIIYKLRHDVRPRYGSVKPAYETRTWLTAGLTFMVMNLFTLLLKQADILFIGHYLSNSKAGIYSAAVRISSLVPLGLTIVDYVYTPRIAQLYENGNHHELQKFITHASRVILLITLPIVTILIFGGKWLLLLFGKEFSASYMPMIILIIGQVINAATGLVAPMLTMTGHQNIFLLVYMAAGILDILLNYLLIPAFGPLGAAIASASALALLNLALYFIVLRKLKVKSSIF